MDSNLILVADDEPSMRLNIVELLEDEGYSVLQASNGTEAIQMTLDHQPIVVLMDIKMAELSGIQALKTIKKNTERIPIIMFTAYGSSEKPIEAMKAGAFDYLEKPFEIDKFLSVVQSAVDQHNKLNSLSNESIQKIESDWPTIEDQIVGVSKKMREVLKLVGKIAPKDTTVLIQGESGTGKEVIADAIYRHSNRSNGPFIKVNCGALPDNLLESELFGHEEGAFTGASKKHLGRFELADNGTIFLDEVNALTLQTQVKLLRILQNFTFERVGGEKTLKTNARVIAATNKNLKQEVEKGNFREDLYYRLNILNVTLPPLRERLDDIEPLAKYFIKKYSAKKNTVISSEALNYLKSYHWPGNVRELENIIERATVMMQGDILEKKDLSISLKSDFSDIYKVHSEEGNIPMQKIIKSVEKDLILKGLHRTNWNKTKAAKLLGINRRLLYSKLDQYDIKENTD
ncbi:sigma-54-dependent transcriptional regulator [Fodinibius sp. SL11]|uniref:sigma-54-dependent transcriptional regulator n=1 Tax=Fodinibius sp. SL11 TaxID=3425690 RepID=UPI003F88036E